MCYPRCCASLVLPSLVSPLFVSALCVLSCACSRVDMPRWSRDPFSNGVRVGVEGNILVVSFRLRLAVARWRLEPDHRRGVCWRQGRRRMRHRPEWNSRLRPPWLTVQLGAPPLRGSWLHRRVKTGRCGNVTMHGAQRIVAPAGTGCRLMRRCPPPTGASRTPPLTGCLPGLSLSDGHLSLHEHDHCLVEEIPHPLHVADLLRWHLDLVNALSVTTRRKQSRPQGSRDPSTCPKKQRHDS